MRQLTTVTDSPITSKFYKILVCAEVHVLSFSLPITAGRMTSVAVIVVYSCAGFLGLVLIAVLLYVLFRRRNAVPASTSLITCHPPEGAYAAPLVVSLSSALESGLFVRIQLGKAIVADKELVTSATAEALGYCQYEHPLRFDVPGSYTINVCAFANDEAGIGNLTTLVYSVLAAKAAKDCLRPPIIVPDSGEISDRTHVHIIPPPTLDSDGGGANVSLHFSTDGTYPSQLYTGPFVISSVAPRPSNSVREVAISAVATFSGRRSSVATALLQVRSGKCQIFDPTIPPPAALVTTTHPKLYFVHTRRDVSIHYTFGYLQKSGQCSILTYEGTPIDLSANVEEVTAWAVSTTIPRIESDKRVYNCARQTDDTAGSNGSLPPPTIMVSCSGVMLEFEEMAPVYKLVYTLDGTEPSLENGAQYHNGQNPVDVMRGQSSSAHIIARFFLLDENGDVRFGERFSRVFCSAPIKN